MTRWNGNCRTWLPGVLSAVAIGVVTAFAFSPTTAQAQAPAQAARQVTLFAIIAMPGSNAIDPKLVRIQEQLRKLLPGHGFRLLDVQSKRLVAGESIRCDLGQGLSASTVLVRPLDENGKIELRIALLREEISQFDTLVATPANQLFFCDRILDNGTRLLIGVGAR